MYTSIFSEEDLDLDKLIGWLKGAFKSIKEVKGYAKFKKLNDSDKEYVLDELKYDGFK